MKSTASLPFSPQSLDGLSGHVEFKRMVSGGASTCMPSPDFDCFERQVSEATEDGFNLPASQLEALHLGGFCSTSDSDEEDYYLDDDGAMWIETTVRHDVGLQSKEDHLCTKTVGVNYTEILEDKLAQVKCLYHARFGEDFESEDTTYDSQLQKLQGSLYEVTALFQQKYGLHVDNLDNDGCAWIKMAGSCCMETLEEKLAEVKCLYHDKFSKDAESEDETYGSQLQRCQDSLCELEALFAQKYGHDIDDVDEDGCVWIQTAGRSRMEPLEEKLAEVKCLYHEKFGANAESDDETYDSQLQRCQDSLCELEALFARKYGHDIDDVDEDGCVWKTAGRSRMETLEEKLAEVKCLYHAKFGTDAGPEDETYDSKLQKCQDSLCEVEALFAQKYGHDIDDVDEDGCVWIKTAGRSRMETLEEKLAEVKCLYHDKFGTDVDEPYDSQLQRCPDSLCELEALFARKYGHDIDDADEDGCMWIKTAGRSRMEMLEEELSQVKCLYQDKFGTDLDETYDSQLNRCQDSLCELEALFAQKYGHDIDDVDEEGCVWINTGGCSSMDTLEVKLAEVKCLYHDKFGTAVDETYDSQLQRSLDSLCELEALFAQKYGHAVNDLDEDGCVWVKTVGDEHVCGITELQPLQVALDTVKSLFRNKYGHDVDDEIFTGCYDCSKPFEV
jgi:Mn-dependent DtxR family transcriptional regulator